jgi:DegV family protein with EDD domain
MSSVKLLTDSSACLPPGLSSRTSVHSIPIAILLGSASLDDGPAQADRVYRAMALAEPTKSAPPSLHHYLDAIEESDSDAVVILTPAVEFTVMYRNARLAATMARRPVEVVDTRTAAAGQGIIVAIAVEAMDAGASALEVAEVARAAAQRTELVASLPSLDSIEGSGHVPATAFAGVVPRGSKPTFRFRDGVVAPLGRPVPASDSDGLLRSAWREGGGDQAERTLFFHAASVGEAHRLRSTCERDDPIVEFSPAMAVHTGLGCVGVAWTRAD